MLLALLRDPRDLPVIRLIARLLLSMAPFVVALFVHFHLAVAVVYLGLVFLRWSAPFAALIHEVVHRPLFVQRWLRVGRGAVEWLLCPLFGLSPHFYAAQHVGMHHPENNLAGDASATIDYQRDSALDFARYFARFLFLAQWEVLAYLHRARKTRLLRRAAIGLVAHGAVVLIALAANWRAALVVFVLPMVLMRLAFAIGNWAQHGFVDAADPASCYRNTITCLSAQFNAATFNSGYHIGHHADLRVHWSELPAEHDRQRARCRVEGAVVFEGIEYAHVFLALMLKRYRWLAERHVDFAEGRAVVERRLRDRAMRIS